MLLPDLSTKYFGHAVVDLYRITFLWKLYKASYFCAYIICIKKDTVS